MIHGISINVHFERCVASMKPVSVDRMEHTARLTDEIKFDVSILFIVL